MDDASAGYRLSCHRAFRRPASAGRSHGFAAGAGRADVGHRRAHLGKPRRWNTTCHRRQARQGNAGALPRHTRGDLVEPADFGQLRRDAAAHRAIVAQPGCPGDHRRRAGRVPGALPHDCRQRHAGAAVARSKTAADQGRDRSGHAGEPAGPLRHGRRGRGAQPAACRRDLRAAGATGAFGTGYRTAICSR